MSHIEGFKEAAEKFAHEAGIKAPAELEHLDERIKIRDAIQVSLILYICPLDQPDFIDSLPGFTGSYRVLNLVLSDFAGFH